MEQILSYSSSMLTANQTPAVYLHHHSISSINKSVGSLNLVSTPTQLWSFSKLTTTSKQHNKLSVKCRQSEYFEQPSRFSSRPANDSSNSPPSAAGLPPRVFVGHYIYKGKAALAVEPRPPEFVPLDSGAYKISKEGFIFLQFAPAAGVRQYDWSRKQVFSLSVPEIGSLISLGSKESCEFFHDPNKGKSEEGKVRKVLKVEPLPHGSGHFFNLSVQNKLLNMDESIYIPISKAEFAVLVTAFKTAISYKDLGCSVTAYIFSRTLRSAEVIYLMS